MILYICQLISPFQEIPITNKPQSLHLNWFSDFCCVFALHWIDLIKITVFFWLLIWLNWADTRVSQLSFDSVFVLGNSYFYFEGQTILTWRIKSEIESVSTTVYKVFSSFVFQGELPTSESLIVEFSNLLTCKVKLFLDPIPDI